MPIQVNGVQYITAQEAAEAVDVSRQTIWRWRKNREIPGGYRFRNGRLLFSREEFAAIRQYANRLQPSEAGDAEQITLFDS